MNSKDFKKYCEDILKNRTTPVITDDMTFTLKKFLSKKEETNFINDVVSASFGEDGEYLPEQRRFAVLDAQVRYYTDIKPIKDESLWHAFTQKFNADFMEYRLSENGVDTYQLAEIEEIIDDKIKYLVNTRMNEIKKELKAITDTFNEMLKNSADIVSDISDDDIQELLKIMGSSDELAEKVVKSYADKYYPEDNSKE